MIELECPPDLRRGRARGAARPPASRTGTCVELVDAERIRELNREHRGIDEPTDVLSFPVDGRGAGRRARASSATS